MSDLKTNDICVQSGRERMRDGEELKCLQTCLCTLGTGRMLVSLSTFLVDYFEAGSLGWPTVFTFLSQAPRS